MHIKKKTLSLVLFVLLIEILSYVIQKHTRIPIVNISSMLLISYFLIINSLLGEKLNKTSNNEKRLKNELKNYNTDLCLVKTKLLLEVSRHNEITTKLEESNLKLKALVHYSTDIILEVNKDYIITYSNPSANIKLEHKFDYLVGKDYVDIEYFKKFETLFNNKLDYVLTTAIPITFETFIGSNCYYWTIMPEFVLNTEDSLKKLIISGRDITQLKKKELELDYNSEHDILTGLFNRKFYTNYKKLLFALDISIIVGDVNGLKLINSTFGPKVGDNVLIHVSNVLKSSCRMEDIVIRIGGDEFVILLNTQDIDILEEIIKRIKRKLTEIEGCPIIPTLSLGYAIKKATDEFETTFKKAEAVMDQNKIYEREGNSKALLNSLEVMLRETTYETLEHSQRLAINAVAIGEKLNLSFQSLRVLETLASLHDIGKVAVPQHILDKPGKLTEEEWLIIKKHPEIGFKIVNEYTQLSDVAQGILCHHERYDGKGYPNGLKGDEIPLLARIITIVDSYDVMTNERSYKKAMPVQDAIEELIRNKGTQFDSELVDVFINDVLNYTLGLKKD